MPPRETVDAATLRRWLGPGHADKGRPVVTLDARNAFESIPGERSTRHSALPSARHDR
ncbi:hypothetical protein [Xylophilus ampelinus]|uniref:hypothetical protein n=1 Tax=Xylophilus ampelinus TaxID=54067 RepID=UPI0035BBBFD8